MAELKYWQAINAAMHEEMERDQNVVLIGEDVGEPGGPFGASRGLLGKFGAHRVKDTPISEAALVGVGIGAALAGARPIVELMFLDFTTLAMDQIAGQAAHIAYLSRGRQKVPLTVRAMCASRKNNGPQHSKNLEAWLAHIPGWRVVWGTTPGDARGLLKSSIRDDNPVIVIESLELWTVKGKVTDDEEGLVQIGKAAIRQTGTDVTLIAAGGILPRAVKTAELAHKDHDISVEVIDLRTISPIDYDCILTSVRKTGRVVIAHDAAKPFGIGAEIAAVVAEECLYDLDAPVRRVGSPLCPVPFSPVLEAAYYPQEEDLLASIKETMRS